MTNKLKEHEEINKKLEDDIEVKNQAKKLIYSTDKSMEELDTKLSNQDKSNIFGQYKKFKERIKQ